MQKYISILRGINVGGKTLKMADLRAMLEEMGFKNVSTYIQSGNVIFQTQREKPEILEKMIKNQIKADFGFDVSVIILTPEKLEKIIQTNPFYNESGKETKFMHVTFLQTKPENYDFEALDSKKAGDEEFAITDDAVYLFCPHGYGKSKLVNSLFENKLKVTATTRNWKTTLKLKELLENVK